MTGVIGGDHILRIVAHAKKTHSSHGFFFDINDLKKMQDDDEIRIKDGDRIYTTTRGYVRLCSERVYRPKERKPSSVYLYIGCFDYKDKDGVLHKGWYKDDWRNMCITFSTL